MVRYSHQNHRDCLGKYLGWEESPIQTPEQCQALFRRCMDPYLGLCEREAQNDQCHLLLLFIMSAFIPTSHSCPEIFVTFPRQESLPPFPLGAHICNKLLSFLLSIHMPTSSFYSDPRPCFLPPAPATLTGCLPQHFRHNSWYRQRQNYH